MLLLFIFLITFLLLQYVTFPSALRALQSLTPSLQRPFRMCLPKKWANWPFLDGTGKAAIV